MRLKNCYHSEPIQLLVVLSTQKRLFNELQDAMVCLHVVRSKDTMIVMRVRHLDPHRQPSRAKRKWNMKRKVKLIRLLDCYFGIFLHLHVPLYDLGAFAHFVDAIYATICISVLDCFGRCDPHESWVCMLM